MFSHCIVTPACAEPARVVHIGCLFSELVGVKQLLLFGNPPDSIIPARVQP
jgi:hypothetical protein